MPLIDDTDRLRALVNAAPIVPSDEAGERLRRRRVRRALGVGLATLIVLSSVAIAGWLVFSGLSDDEPEVAIRASSDAPDEATTPTREQSPLPTPNADRAGAEPIGSADAFRELRYLPAGAVTGMELQVIHRLPAAAPIATFVRSNGDRVTGTVFIDTTPGALVAGLGVPDPVELDVHGVTGAIVPSGRALSHVIEWNHPTLGPLRAWGVGLTSAEQQAVIGELVASLDASPGKLMPDGWRRVASYRATDLRPVWRAFYLGPDGETAVIATSALSATASAIVDAGDCVVEGENDPTCEGIDVQIDEDGVEIVLIASPARLPDLRSQLLPMTASNARIRTTELEPMALVPTTAAATLLYVPVESGEWQVAETLTYASSRPVSEPLLVLVERESPEVGGIVSALLVQVAPDTVSPSAGERDGGEIASLLTTKFGIDYQLVGWRHAPSELALIDRLLAVDETGLRFVDEAQASVGLLRQYDEVLANPVPSVIVEGNVFSARLVNAAGDEATIRVSQVPSYVPEGAAARSHQNERVVVSVRGVQGALIVSGDTATLEWEEQPGVLIRLSGSDDADLLGLADTLELVSATDLPS